jgi:DNA-directed RNA polymerase subunit RPC12/RpoP
LETYYLIAAFVVLALGSFAFFKKSKPVKRSQTSTYAGPSSVNFICASCSQEFTHTKRTIAAWKKGLRRISCNNCHKNWRDSRPPEEVARQEKNRSSSAAPQMETYNTNSSNARSSSRPNIQSDHTGNRTGNGRSGCFGILFLISLLPTYFIIHAL